MYSTITFRRPIAPLARVGISAVCVGVGFVGGHLASAREGAPQPAAPLLSSGTTIMGEKIVYPSDAPARITAAVVTLAPGADTGWHTHGVPVFGYVLEGELSVDYAERGTRVYRAGDAVLEAMSVLHNGRNTGAGPMRILAVFTGAEGLRTSIPATR